MFLVVLIFRLPSAKKKITQQSFEYSCCFPVFGGDCDVGFQFFLFLFNWQAAIFDQGVSVLASDLTLVFKSDCELDPVTEWM